MTPADLAVDLEEGRDIEVRKILEDPRRKVVRITLRRGAVLKEHEATTPITILGLQGTAELRVGDAVHTLSPLVLVPLDPRVRHEVVGRPAASFLVTFFRGG